MKSLYDFTLKELQDEMVSLNQKSFRGNQVFSWVYQKRVNSIDDMSDVSVSFRIIIFSRL